MKALICIDRDGTLIHDEKYHLGHTRDWKKKIRLHPKAAQAVKILNKIPNSAVYLITNQPGIAIKEFPLLTMERAEEVCKEVVKRFKKQGAEFKGYFVCPHPSPEYVMKRKEFHFIKRMVCNCACIKPRAGMIEWALKKERWKRKNTRIYVVGDRISDIQTGINAGGKSVFVKSRDEAKEEKKAKELYAGSAKVYFAKDLVEGARHIAKDVKWK